MTTRYASTLEDLHEKAEALCCKLIVLFPTTWEQLELHWAKADLTPSGRSRKAQAQKAWGIEETFIKQYGAKGR